ncbi:MAG TPA: hypothetical protein VFR34_10265 [Paracoccaceae bacterium]|nr:hypothetical protein [Paracoccaceae bacterium]
MEVFQALQSLPLAALVRGSTWAYAGVNAAHIFAISLLVGAILPLNLRLLGFWPSVPLAGLTRILRPVAAAGLTLAILSGSLLFLTRAPDYVATPLFRLKLALAAIGILNALLHSLRPLDALPPARQRFAGALSLAVWPSVLACGRALGYL